ncbi:MAG: hypothetical protein QW272_05080 [Candidatus Methanomethylicaceae archaeon]
MSIEEISKKFGISQEIASKIFDFVYTNIEETKNPYKLYKKARILKNEGLTIKEISKKYKKSRTYISELLFYYGYAEKDFSNKEYVLEKVSYGAVKMYYGYSSNDFFKDFLKNKIIEKAEKGERVGLNDMKNWVAQAKSLLNKNKNEEETLKKFKEKKKKEKKEIEPFEKRRRGKIDNYSYAFPSGINELWKKYAFSIADKNLMEYKRNCIERIIKESNLTIENIERIFKEEAEKLEK